MPHIPGDRALHITNACLDYSAKMGHSYLWCVDVAAHTVRKRGSRVGIRKHNTHSGVNVTVTACKQCSASSSYRNTRLPVPCFVATSNLPGPSEKLWNRPGGGVRARAFQGDS